MSALITPGLVALDADLGTEPATVIRHLAELVVAAGRASEVEGLYADAMAREAKTATGIPGGLAIPHCRSTAVLEPTLAMARLATRADFGSADGAADLVFFIAAPAGADQAHLKLLAKLARSLMKKDFTASLRSAASAEEIVAIVTAVVSPDAAQVAANEAASAAAAAATPAVAAGATSLVAITACPTGIAHTYMAADALVAAAREAGVDLQVETQGSAGLTPLDPAVIAAAGAVIFAVDVDVRGRERFIGKPVINAPVKRGIDEPKELIAEALAAAHNPNARRVSGGADPGAEQSAESGEHLGQQLKRALLTGVSYMIPFVAGGGLLIALGFLLAGYEIALGTTADDVLAAATLTNLPPEGLIYFLGAVLFKIGALSMGFLVPALAGYIAYAIADRPGIAPGFVSGAVAGYMGAGFLGGIVGGLLAGVVAKWIGSFAVPRWLRGLMPVVIIPLLASIVASGLMFLVLGGPIAALTEGLNSWLTGMSGAGAITLGIILGLMMAFDLGGPVNKVAYAFAVAGLSAATVQNQAPWEIMATVMAAGMVPPLAMALATTVDRRLFSLAERENGKAAWLLGASFISEGAIPFAAADPLRVIPSCMLGAATTGAIVMGSGVTSKAPHGGIFVFFAIGNVGMFVLAIAIGTVISAAAVIALKRYAVRKAPADEPAGDLVSV
ncbi:PTS fructose transporter subunit IIABC [Pengzhenrongella sicca]|uniref:PTS sugar transporter subunit IIA n=1 Tax=Pengzhenrongella sicca TaxID=2819238 RepID=A0A8A4ZF99_9MICO|nr:fructose-specific PTS transporter subunit EIIC [Pengzhenrongella sicca]QTE30564.1 PTS sugar transporter subunit IIA [Pengzhenrongella sicca]